MDGDNILAAILIIIGPKPSTLVALVESSLLINDKFGYVLSMES